MRNGAGSCGKGGEDASFKTHHLVLDRRVFSWASYMLGLDIDEFWWPTDLVSGYKRGPECRKNSTCT
jgi:hypothetical protein